MGDFLTIRDIRRATNEPAHVINHALDRFGPAPVGRIGIARVWRPEDLPAIRESLRKTSIRSSIRERRAAVATP
jgi:hypothetical protein